MESPSSFPAHEATHAPGPHATGIGHVLVVCTGNVCRSPLGDILLQSLLEGTGITVSSAGVYAMEGHGVDAGMLPELTSRGLSPEGFVAHQITRDDVDAAGLIITMSRRQRALIVDEWPHARKKTLLLASAPELVKEASEHAADGPAQAPGHGRRSSRPLTPPHCAVTVDTVHTVARMSLPHVLDIPDPYRKSAKQYGESAALVEEHIRTLAGALLTTIDLYQRERSGA